MARQVMGTLLLVLQLLALGYSPRQIAGLTARTPDDVRRLMDEAVEALGAADEEDAIAVARRRGLLA